MLERAVAPHGVDHEISRDLLAVCALVQADAAHAHPAVVIALAESQAKGGTWGIAGSASSVSVVNFSRTGPVAGRLRIEYPLQSVPVTRPTSK